MQSHISFGGGVFGVIAALLLIALYGLLPGAIVTGGMDLTAFAGALKELYGPQKIQTLIYKKNTLFKLLNKFTKFGGKSLPVPVVYGNPTGIGSTYATAQSNIVPSPIVEFQLTRATYYGFVRVDHQTLLASKDDPGAFLRAKEVELNGMLTQLGRRLAISLYANGSGVMGQLDASVTLASPTILLRDISTVTNYEKGMVIALSAANDGTGAVRAGNLQIIKVDRQLGILTVDQNITAGIAAATVNDYISVAGDYAKWLSGLDAWIPTTAPGATPFFGVDRSPDTTRLGGVRVDLTGAPIEEAVIDLVNKAEREGASPDIMLMNHAQFRALEKAQSGKVMYTNPPDGAGAKLGFKTFSVNGQNGPVEILMDVNCPNTKIYCLQSDTLTLNSLGDAPSLFDTDGLPFLRTANTDEVEIRAYAYPQLGCNAPGWNAVGTVTAAP